MYCFLTRYLVKRLKHRFYTSWLTDKLIQTNIDIVVTVLDLIQVCNVQGRVVTGVKMLLFLALIIVLFCMLVIIIIKKKDLLVLIGGTTQGLYNITSTYHNNFTRPGRRLLLKMHYNRISRLLFVNAMKVY